MRSAEASVTRSSSVIVIDTVTGRPASFAKLAPSSVSTPPATLVITRGPLLLAALPSMKICLPTAKAALQLPLLRVRVLPEKLIACVRSGSRSATRSMSSTPLDSPTLPLTTAVTVAPVMLAASIVTVVSVTSFSKPALTL